MSITPGDEPRSPDEEPLLADEPLPPGNGDIAEQVEELDQRLRALASEETAQAQKSKESPDAPTEGEEDQPDAS